MIFLLALTLIGVCALAFLFNWRRDPRVHLLAAILLVLLLAAFLRRLSEL